MSNKTDRQKAIKKAYRRTRGMVEVLKKHGVRITMEYLRPTEQHVVTQSNKRHEVEIIRPGVNYPIRVLRHFGCEIGQKGGLSLLRLRGGFLKKPMEFALVCDDRDQFRRDIAWVKNMQTFFSFCGEVLMVGNEDFIDVAKAREFSREMNEVIARGENE